MDNIKLYEVDSGYIEYLCQYAPHLFMNKKTEQQNERKYIGIVLQVNGFNYFAPLSSFKEKHKYMSNKIDFIKIKNYAVINLNNMFPVVDGVYSYVNINNVRNEQYQNLLRAEYRFIKSIQDKIRKNALSLYNLKTKSVEETALTKRCNDFALLELVCNRYNK